MTLSRRTLRAMKARWQADLARLNAAYPDVWSEPDASFPELETVRNLSTAIAEIDGMITSLRKGDPA